MDDFDVANSQAVAPQGAQQPRAGFDIANSVVVGANASPPMGMTSAPEPAASSQLGDFLNAAGHHALKPLHGAAQLIENAGAKLADWVDPTPQNLSSVATGQRARAPWNQAIQSVVNSDNAALADWERSYQASTSDSPAAYAGATVGEVAPFFVNGVASGLTKVGDTAANLVSRFAASAPKILPKIAGSAAQGATAAAVAPVNAPGDYWNNKAGQVGQGALVGSAIPAASAALRSVGDVAAPFVNPGKVVGNWAADQAVSAGISPADLAAQLRDAPELVPGSRPTTAQAAPLPFLVQAEKTVTRNPNFKGAFADIAAQNNSARIGQIGTVAGKPGELEQLIADRDAQAATNYRTAYANGPNPELVTPEIQSNWDSLITRPAIKDAFGQARKDLANQDVTLPATSAPTDPHIVQLGDAAKKALDARISSLISRGTNEGLSGLITSRDDLVTALDAISPDYQAARQAYADASPPINSMQAGQAINSTLLGKSLTTAVPGELTGAPMITPDAYRGALARALKAQEFGIEPDKEAALRAVASDLQRSTASNADRIPGSDTAYNLQAPGWLARSIYGNGYSGAGTAAKGTGAALGAALGHLLGGGGVGEFGGAAGGAYAGSHAINYVAEKGGARVMQQLSDALADPQKMASLVESARSGSPTRANAEVLRIAQALKNSAPYAIAAGN
jgi:hypothetical protein